MCWRFIDWVFHLRPHLLQHETDDCNADLDMLLFVAIPNRVLLPTYKTVQSPGTYIHE